jgi:hypothetical protein
MHHDLRMIKLYMEERRIIHKFILRQFQQNRLIYFAKSTHKNDLYSKYKLSQYNLIDFINVHYIVCCKLAMTSQSI